LSSSESFDKTQWHMGTVNTGIGLSYDLPRNRIIQVGSFYQKSIGGLGREDIKQNLFGLKRSFWFQVR